MSIAQNQDSVFDKLSQQAEERLEEAEAEAPAEWGEELELAEGEKFFGRFLDTTAHPATQRTVRLLLAPDKTSTWYRDRTVLTSEMDRVRPQRGDYIVIARGDDKEGKSGPYHLYAVAVAPCADPLPEGVSDDIPFS
jgi:hypothetical protein